VRSARRRAPARAGAVRAGRAGTARAAPAPPSASSVRAGRRDCGTPPRPHRGRPPFRRRCVRV